VPINAAPPTITGDPRVGSTLTAAGGSWDGTTGALAFQWVRCAAAACAPIAGATSSTYTAGDADEGNQLRVDVTGTAPGGEADTASAITSGVKPGPPQSTGPPTVSGEARGAETLSGTTGNWTGTPSSFRFQWRRCANADGTSCVDIAGANGSNYLLGPGDVGSTVRLRVVATNGQGSSLPADSAPTAVVQREVIRARLSLPSNACTGLSTVLDGSASTTPNGPIKRYRFQGQEFPIGILLLGVFNQNVLIEYIAKVPKFTIADGATPSPGVEFSWNRQLDHDERPGLKGFYARDPLVVTLTVTDLSGASSTAVEVMGFSQSYSNQSRSSCPKPFRDRLAYVLGKAKLSYSAGAVNAKIPCKSRIGCAGRLKLVTASGRRGAGGTKPLLIASSGVFEIQGQGSKTVAAKLTRTGRALLRTHAPVAATLIITNITPLGRRVNRSFPVTLRLPR
jgi:hypothetical protein